MRASTSFRSIRQYLAVLLLCSCAAAAIAAPRDAEPFRVAVTLSEDGGAYAEVANAVRDGLAREGAERFRVAVLVANRDASNLASALEAELVVTVGMRAASAVQQLAPRVPVLFTLVPKAALDKLLAVPAAKGSGPRSGIYLDQPLDRQLELIKLIIPAVTHVGVIYGPDSSKNAGALEAAAAGMGLKIEAETVANSEQVTPALRRVLERGEVLLGLPDPEVFNQNTVHNLLLAAYRAGDAVFAFSPAYVKAGALAGVFSSSTHIGTQAAQMIVKFLGQASLPEPQYPKYFSVVVNRTVARSMGIPIEEEGALQQKLQNLAKAD
jgi:putative tryptophan/tyrosine transport system substrate-binding protein